MRATVKYIGPWKAKPPGLRSLNTGLKEIAFIEVDCRPRQKDEQERATSSPLTINRLLVIATFYDDFA